MYLLYLGCVYSIRAVWGRDMHNGKNLGIQERHSSFRLIGAFSLTVFGLIRVRIRRNTTRYR